MGLVFLISQNQRREVLVRLWTLTRDSASHSELHGSSMVRDIKSMGDGHRGTFSIMRFEMVLTKGF